MTESIRVLSVYEGFFVGGARILHSDILVGLAREGMHNFIISLNEVMRRDATVQRMREDRCYRNLTSAGVIVDSLRPCAEEVPDNAEFSPSELARFEQYVSRADVVLSLKEQPLHLINQVDTAGKPVVVCLHRSDPENQGAALLELRKAVLSGKVTVCICCAESTREAYFRAGIPAGKLRVVTNGIDLRSFKPNAMNRAKLRVELGIPQGSPVVVFAARYDRAKNFPLFLRSARLYLRKEIQAHIIMCGAGVNYENKNLIKIMKMILENDTDLAVRIHLLSIREDVEAVYAAADVVALTSSVGEAYPLSLVEGMMCGAVPVATDVGDISAIVAGRGIITPDNPIVIVSAWREAYARRNEFRAAAMRDRSFFDREKMVVAYSEIIREMHDENLLRIATGQRSTSASLVSTTDFSNEDAF